MTTYAMPPVLTLIADDLTGALDSVAPFAARGLHVTVALGPEHLAQALATGPEILAVTTASREIPTETARTRVARVVAELPPTRLFKKVDSRLKGNIEAELSALDFRRALAAPAIPEFGRIQREGRISGFGLDQPISIADRLGKHAARCLIPDITTPEDMQAIAASDFDLLIGARGLAEALARQMRPEAPTRITGLPGPASFVIGSRDPITLEQVEALRAIPDLVHVPAPNGQFSAPLPDAKLLMLQAVPGAAPASPARVATDLACAARPLLQRGAGTAVLVGGESALALLAQAGAAILTVRGESLPGLVVSDLDGLTIVTKSGGFGSPDCLVQLASMIEGVPA